MLSKPTLFLLRPGFSDATLHRGERVYFCPDSAYIEGVLSYYPILRSELDVIYVDFEKPRKGIVDLIGEANQSCPVLIVEPAASNAEVSNRFTVFHGYQFANDPRLIVDYLVARYGIGEPHP